MALIDLLATILLSRRSGMPVSGPAGVKIHPEQSMTIMPALLFNDIILETLLNPDERIEVIVRIPEEVGKTLAGGEKNQKWLFLM